MSEPAPDMIAIHLAQVTDKERVFRKKARTQLFGVWLRLMAMGKSSVTFVDDELCVLFGNSLMGYCLSLHFWQMRLVRRRWKSRVSRFRPASEAQIRHSSVLSS